MFFIKPVAKIHIQNIILFLNTLKAVGHNSIPTEILKLFSSSISNYLSELFNLSFSHGVFPSNLKSNKVIPIFKKPSKLKYSNYCPIFLLSNIHKILEGIKYDCLHEFLESKHFIYDQKYWLYMRSYFPCIDPPCR